MFPEAKFPLQVSENGRYFIDQAGTPFFWLGDTQWEIFRLFPLQDARVVLEKRQQQGYSVIHAMLTGVGDGTSPDLSGQSPWEHNNPSQTNEAYFKNVDAVLDLQISKTMVWVIGIFHQLQKDCITVDKARQYARWVAERYRQMPNIIWSMYPQAKLEYLPVLRELAAGLQDGDNGTHLISVHPDPSPTSSSFIHTESWLACNMIQTCIDYELICSMVSQDYSLLPHKPVIMAEGGYEGEEFGKIQNALEIRQQAYWSYLNGGFHTYGHNESWSLPATWKSWIDSPGSQQLSICRSIITSCSEWWKASPDEELFVNRKDTDALNVAIRSGDATWALVYLPKPGSLTLRMDRITSGKKVKASWVDPTSGGRSYAGLYAPNETPVFISPADWEDALLFLEKSK